MEFLFGRGSRFAAFGQKLAELLWLNFLTLVCCLGVVTAGSALSSMHKVLVQIYRDEESGITRTYFAAFRENFPQATKGWLVYLLYFGILALDAYALQALENPTLRYLDILLPLLTLVGLLSMQWFFVLQSRYRLSLRSALLYSFTRMIAFPFRTLFMGLCLALPVAAAIYLPQFFIVVVLLGLSGPGLLSTCFYHHALEVMEDDTSGKDD